MNVKYKIAVVLVLACLVGVVLALKNREKPTTEQKAESALQTERQENVQDANQAEVTVALPRLVDLGAGKCIPCKMMEPILEELKHEYADQFSVTFYDVWENREYAQLYGIRSIPTQVFLNPEGKEIFRHEGFFSKEDILKKWKELGYAFEVKDKTS